MPHMPPKYKGQESINLLHRLFRQGKDIAHFCVEAGISRICFYKWIHTHPEFKEQYEIALEAARARWEDIGEEGLNDPGFNQNVWCRIMLNRFEMTLHRKVKVPGMKEAETPKAQFNCVKSEIDHGNITPDEALKLAHFVEVGAKIEEATDWGQRLKALEDANPSKVD